MEGFPNGLWYCRGPFGSIKIVTRLCERWLQQDRFQFAPVSQQRVRFQFPSRAHIFLLLCLSNYLMELPEPVQMGQTRLTTFEQQGRVTEGRCIYSAQVGGFISSCLVRSPTPNSATSSLGSRIKLCGMCKTPLTKVMLQLNYNSLVLRALVHSQH